MKFIFILMVLASGALYASEQAVVSVARVVDVRANVYKPPIWIATKGDVTVTVLGFVRDLPAGIDWDEGDLSVVADKSKSFVFAPQLDLDLGWFGKIGAMASVMRHVNYSDGTAIDKLIGGADFLAIKQAAVGLSIFSDGFVREHPAFSSQDMMNKIMDKMGIPKHPPFDAWMRGVAARRGLSVIYPRVAYSVDHPSVYLKAVVMDDADGFKCLIDLSRLENRSPDFFRRRAEAWSEGDLAAMSKLDDSAISSCAASKIPASISRNFGVGDYQLDMLNAWASSVLSASKDGGSVFTIIDMSVNNDYMSYLEKLRGLGFLVRRE